MSIYKDLITIETDTHITGLAETIAYTNICAHASVYIQSGCTLHQARKHTCSYTTYPKRLACPLYIDVNKMCVQTLYVYILRPKKTRSELVMIHKTVIRTTNLTGISGRPFVSNASNVCAHASPGFHYACILHTVNGRRCVNYGYPCSFWMGVIDGTQKYWRSELSLYLLENTHFTD